MCRRYLYICTVCRRGVFGGAIARSAKYRSSFYLYAADRVCVLYSVCPNIVKVRIYYTYMRGRIIQGVSDADRFLPAAASLQRDPYTDYIIHVTPPSSFLSHDLQKLTAAIDRDSKTFISPITLHLPVYNIYFTVK